MLVRALSMLLLIAALGGCSISGLLPDWPSADPAGPEPAYRFIIANRIKEIVGEPSRAGILEISGVRRVEFVQGGVLGCLHQGPAHSAAAPLLRSVHSARADGRLASLRRDRPVRAAGVHVHAVQLDTRVQHAAPAALICGGVSLACTRPRSGRCRPRRDSCRSAPRSAPAGSCRDWRAGGRRRSECRSTRSRARRGPPTRS